MGSKLDFLTKNISELRVAVKTLKNISQVSKPTPEDPSHEVLQVSLTQHNDHNVSQDIIPSEPLSEANEQTSNISINSIDESVPENQIIHHLNSNVQTIQLI